MIVSGPSRQRKDHEFCSARSAVSILRTAMAPDAAHAQTKCEKIIATKEISGESTQQDEINEPRHRDCPCPLMHVNDLGCAIMNG